MRAGYSAVSYHLRILRQACAEALSMAGRPAEAVEQLRAIDAVQPGRRDVRRLLAMELAGLEGARLYAGSWSEWIRDPDRPVAGGPRRD